MKTKNKKLVYVIMICSVIASGETFKRLGTMVVFFWGGWYGGGMFVFNLFF